KIIDLATGAVRASFFPYGAAALKSIQVALGDVDGNGRLNVIVAADTDAGTWVQTLDMDGNQLSSFYVLDPSIGPGASLAAGDLDGDGKAELVFGGGPTTAPWPPFSNGPDQRVAVYESDGTELGSFSAYPGLFQGGVRVALADLYREGRPVMVTAPGRG